METRVKTMRTETRDLVKEFNKTEDDLKALQVQHTALGTGSLDIQRAKFVVILYETQVIGELVVAGTLWRISKSSGNESSWNSPVHRLLS